MNELSRRLLPAVVAVGVFFQVAYGLHSPALVHNTDGYVDIATMYARTGTLADDEGRPTALREPLYPLLLGVVFKVFGPVYPATRAVNWALGALTLLSIFWAGRLLFGERTALLATAIAAVYPQFVYYSAQPLRETLIALMSVLSVGTLVWASRSERWERFALAGAANAGASLTITSFLPFGLLLAPPALLWLRRGEQKKAVRWTAVYCCVFLATYGLWPLRNYRAFGTWVLGSTAAAGMVFYAYQIVPQDVGGTPRETEILKADPVYMNAIAIPDRVRSQQVFWKAGLAKAGADPARFARLFAWRFLWDQWRLYPRPRAYDHGYAAIKWASLLTDGWILPLALVGLLWALRRPPETFLIALLVGSLTAVDSLLLTIIRFRIPMMPWLILLAAYVLTRGGEALLVE